jgi:invasion protein IalB
LPVGCLSDFDFDTAAMAAMNKGTTLKINVVADGGKDTIFNISLKGFAGAFTRTLELAKSTAEGGKPGISISR